MRIRNLALNVKAVVERSRRLAEARRKEKDNEKKKEEKERVNPDPTDNNFGY